MILESEKRSRKKLLAADANLGKTRVSTLVISSMAIMGLKEVVLVRKMDHIPIYFGFWCLMTNTTKLD